MIGGRRQLLVDSGELSVVDWRRTEVGRPREEKSQYQGERIRGEKVQVSQFMVKR